MLPSENFLNDALVSTKIKIDTSWSDKPSHICHNQPYLFILLVA